MEKQKYSYVKPSINGYQSSNLTREIAHIIHRHLCENISVISEQSDYANIRLILRS